MSELKDQPIDQGVRKRAEYDNSQRKRLSLNIDREDGGKLSLPIAVDMRSHEEEENIQQNTFLAIMPLARLPGHTAVSEAPRGALPRQGHIYVFQNGKVWREVLCDGKGNLKDVDVAYWRKQAESGAPADDRQPVGKQQQVLLTPILVQGQSVSDNFQMSYSEKPWTWEYIEWLESNQNRVNFRAQMVSIAWAAAVVGQDQWRPTQIRPSVVISAQSNGFRARDFSIESLLGDPSLFTPGLTALASNEMSSRMQMRLQELAVSTKSPAPHPLPTLEAGTDVLAEGNLRAHPKLVGLMLDDPLFALRHAAAQARLAESYLLTLNALVPHRPNGQYAHALYSSVIQSTSSPLNKFKKHLDQVRLNDALFDGERRQARTFLSDQLQRMTQLVSLAPLTAAFWDWQHTRDERLLEPYQLLSEVFSTLNKLPEVVDALSPAVANNPLQKTIAQLSERLLKGDHPLTREFLAKADGSVPEAVKRLIALAEEKREPSPDRMGMSSLLHLADIDPQDTDQGLVYKNLHALVGDFMEHFSVGVLTQFSRLKDSKVAMSFDLSRMFGPTHGVVEKLSPKWKNIKIVTADQAQAQNLRILAVNSNGLQNGLLPEERRAIKRSDIKYADVLSDDGQVLGSTSPRRVASGQPNLGRTQIIAAPADHPEAIKYRAWKHSIAQNLSSAASTPAIPLVAVACAIYNLEAQIEGMKGLAAEGGDGAARYVAGKWSAYADLTVALGNLGSSLLGKENSLVKIINGPRFSISKLPGAWGGKLAEQTGHRSLPMLRAASGVAMFFTTAISMWDAERAWRQGDHDAALAYGVAAAGGAAWTAYALGMCINPIVLVAGAVLFIGGTIVAGWLVDSDIEALLKNGPFGQQHGQTSMLDNLLGDDSRFAHLKSSDVAYEQLMGILGRPVIQANRLGTWLDSVPASVRVQVGIENRQRSPMNPALECRFPSAQPFEKDDWVVSIYSPLLTLFSARQFQLFAREDFGVLRLSGISAEETQRREINGTKLDAFPLNDSTIIYILPKQFPVAQQTPLGRHGRRITHRLKVFGQFRLAKNASQENSLVLPQPSPKTWKPFQATDTRHPPANSRSGDVLYWQIETLEFVV
jgi:hypothetical protein